MTNLETFYNNQISAETWGSLVEKEIKARILLSVAAFAYEYKSDSIMSDGEFDSLSLKINKSMKTGNDEMDKFFKTKFDPNTGQWIHAHPERNKIEKIYELYYKK